VNDIGHDGMIPKLIPIALMFVIHGAAADVLPIEHQTQSATFRGEHFTLKVPRGYVLTRLTTEMQRPRLFTFDQAGNMIVGSRSGHVYRLTPPYKNPEILLSLPDYPHGVAMRGDYLYIAQTSSLGRIRYQPTMDLLDEDNLEEIVAIPGGGGHSSRTLRVGPDKRLYVSLGITGNCSDEYLHSSYAFTDRRGGVMVLDETVRPPVWKSYASGLRNPIGFDWHPSSKVMYASNNGPDHLGYDQPPEYFSRLTEDSFHGMPWYQYDGSKMRRDDCADSTPPRDDVTKPVAVFPARNAPMDVHFIDKGELMAGFANSALVALHGSWGTRPDGSGSGHPATRRPPSIVMLRFEKGEVVRVDDFISGFQNDEGHRLARPMGLGIGPDGALYITSDGGINGLYRLGRP